MMEAQAPRPFLFGRIVAGYAAALLLLLGAGALSMRGFDATLRARARSRQALAVRESLAAVMMRLDDMGTDARAYAATGDPFYRGHYEAARREIGAAFGDGRFPSLGEPDQQERLRSVELASRLSAELSARVLDLPRGRSAAARRALLAASEAAVTRARDRGAELDRAEEAVLGRYEADAARATAIARGFIAGGSGLGALLLAGAAWIIHRELRARETLAERVRANQERLQAILDNTPAVVFIKDAEGRYLLVNRALERMFKVTNEGFRGKTDFELFPAPVAERVRADDREALRAGRTVATEETVPSPSGPRTYLTLKFPLPRREGGAAVCGIATDVTELRRGERLRGEVVALASHEMRTPMTIILAALRMALSLDPAALPGETRECLEMALRNSRHMQALIESYLSLAALEAGETALEPEPVDLKTFAEDAAAGLRLYLSEKEIKVRFVASPAPARARADARRLREVLDNILSNAAKFSPAQGVITVRLHRRPRSCVVTVRDHGPGIRKEFEPLVFQKFKRDKSIEGAGRGTGLGLSIAKAIVERMDGTIGFRTKEGLGSVFWFELPTA